MPDYDRHGDSFIGLSATARQRVASLSYNQTAFPRRPCGSTMGFP
ncbi:hypothetical protein BRI6_4496 [plant metagenome]|uniref:Uncharacterized protein n=1 Tax=plant metagenome TaxID=1297885 RepID=A0A484RQ90_9ZZZZ